MANPQNKEILDAIDAAIEEPAQPPPAMPKPAGRRPGRPPKKRPEIAANQFTGISDKPASPDDWVEMIYYNPLMFKKLFALYKAYEVSEIEMIFEPTGVRMVAKDHLGKSTIYTTIEGRLLNFYYCRERIMICVKREYLEKILSNLDKNQFQIIFLLKENYRSSLHIIIKDCQYDKDKSYEVEINYKVGDHIYDIEADKDYPIKFILDSKHFKTEINQVRKMSPLLTIQKVGEEPLQFTFDDAKKLNYSGVYKTSDKIKLQSNITPDDIFTVSICIDYIKPFSNSCIGDEVFIAADKREKLSLMTFLDKKPDGGHVIAVKIFTEIKDYRRQV